MKKKTAKAAKWLAGVICTPVALFLLLAILLYIPPVQNFAVQRVASALSASTGTDFSVERVRLAFPLDLSIHGARAKEKGDTLLEAKSLRLSVRLLPLFEGRADVDGFELRGVKIDTKSYVSDTHIKGRADCLSAAAHGIAWAEERVSLDNVRLSGADFDIALSDTAKKDTTESTARWVITLKAADLDNAAVRLSMPGDSMRIAARIGKAQLRGGVFDTGKNAYSLKSIALRDCGVDYDLPYEKPAAGIDANHISLTSLSLIADTLSYKGEKGMCVTAGIRKAALKEKCGLHVTDFGGGIALRDSLLKVTALRLYTPHTKITADASVPFDAFSPKGRGVCQANVSAEIGTEDVRILGRGFLPADYLKALPVTPVTLAAKAHGNTRRAVIEQLSLSLPGIAKVTAEAETTSPLEDWRRGTASFALTTMRLAPLRRLMPASVRRSFDIPDGTAAKGNISFDHTAYTAYMRLTARGGTLAAKAQADTRKETYRAALAANAFPVASFVRGLDVTPFSGRVKAEGCGFDPLSSRCRLTAEANVSRFAYAKYDLSGLTLDARLRDGQAKCVFHSPNEQLRADGTLLATIGKRRIDVGLQADIPGIDLREIGATQDSVVFGTSIDLQGHTDRSFTAYGVSGSLRANHFTTPRRSMMAKDLDFAFETSRDTTTARVSAGDLVLRLGAGGGLTRITEACGRIAAELTAQAERRSIDQERLKQLLPPAALYLEAGQDNPLYNIARFKGYSFTSAYLNLNTDPHLGMTGAARVGGIDLGNLQLDTIDTHIVQDTTGVQLYGVVKNYKKTNPTPLEVRLKSYILATGAGIELTYLDEEGDTGVNLGLQANVAEDGISLHLYPEHPVLAYRNFRVNADNYIFLGKDKSIKANIDLLADDGTGLQIYDTPNDSLNDLTLSVRQVNLAELSTVMPYLPHLGGKLDGDIHVTANPRTEQISAMASLDAEGFKYEGTDLGDVGIEAIYLPKGGGEHHASAFISSNGEEVLACNGTYHDTPGDGDGTFEGNAQLHDFPLQMLNGMLAGSDIALTGIAKGDLSVKGTLARPVLNGSLDLDEAHIYSDVYGFDFRTDERAVEIKDSRLLFKEYNLYSTGKQPLVLDGQLDMSDFSRIGLDFAMRAQNFELINTKKKAKSMVFGKVYSNFNGTMKGTADNLYMRGKLEVLDRTDVTYILKDSPLSVDDRLHDLVQFVDFSDTTATEEVKTAAESGFDMTLGISVSDAAQFHCNLSEDGQSYVNIEGGGDLTMRMTQQGDTRLTGRFTVNSGEMKYALPVIPLKTFQLVQGSYVEFTGDMMNPTLNITAKERTKAVVTENDQQRSVSFDVGVQLTQPLDKMGLEFTIEAPEDLNVQNQLAAMSKEQRGKAAVAMMATGMYMTDESTMSGTGFKASNALNAFLQSEIQNIAGSALKTIDISLGVESGTSETGTSTTDYSFQFAKRFWGNRISVILGGKVSTGADAQNTAGSFINNVSVEYRLDQGASRYVKVFYDRDTQDPLEGQLTKGGAGLVLRRKTDRLGELFLFKRKSGK